jgi:AraC-like DNA-binding protein
MIIPPCLSAARINDPSLAARPLAGLDNECHRALDWGDGTEGGIGMAEPVVTHTTSVRTGSSFALPQVIGALGASPAAVFAEAGVARALYGHPENRIAVRDLGRLFLCAARTTGRPDIALLAVDGFRPAGLGLVGEVAAEGPDVRTTLRNLVRLLPHNTLAGYPVLIDDGPTAVMKFELRESDFPGSEFVFEGATGIIVRLLRWLCGDDWRAEEIHLCRRAPAAPGAFERFFRAPVRFSATEDAVLLAADWLDRPVPRESRRRDSRRVEIASAPWSERVRRQVATRLGLAPLSAEAIAADLGISRRQLFRHLKAEGASVQGQVDAFRFARACHLLVAGDAPLDQIAFALGFPEQSSFTRSFKRWSGFSPNGWRRVAHALERAAAP